MSPTVRQGLLIAIGGLALVGIVTTLARRRMISIRYAFGWLAIALLTIVAAAAASLVNPIARTFDMTGTAVFLAGATAILVAIAIQLSISVSGLQNQLRDLSEAHALLAERVEQLEHRSELV